MIHSGDYSLTHIINPLTIYTLSHKPDSLDLEGSWGLWNQDRTWVSLFTKSSLRQGTADNTLTNKMAIRVQNEDNLLISVGFEDWDCLSGNSPNILNLWTLYGKVIEGWRPFAGFNIGFNSNLNKLHYHKYLVGIKQLDWTLAVHTDFNRRHVLIPSSSDTYTMETTLICDGRIDKDFRLSSEMKIEKNPLRKEPDAKFSVAGEYRIDPATLLKAKVMSDQSLLLSLNRNFRQLIDLCFTSRVINI